MNAIADQIIADETKEWEAMPTKDLIEAWRARREEAEIEAAVTDALKLLVEGRGEVVIADGAECIETFRGTYAWESIARIFNPTAEQIKQFTKVEWNKLAEKIAPSKKELVTAKGLHYDQGPKFMQLRLIKKDE